MAYLVKCPVCGEKFSKDKEEYVHVGKRYYHKKCYDSLSKEKENSSMNERDKLHEVICNLFRIDYPTPRILKQINTFYNQGYSYKGMWMTLEYFFSVRDNLISKARGGIGIIPFVYIEASDYYKKIKTSEKLNKGKKIIVGEKMVIIDTNNKQSMYDKRKIDISKL